MSFLANFFEGLKGIAPTRTNSPSRTNDNVISSQIDEEDWEIINAHEAGVTYHDRITLLLGPRQETRHQILFADMPKSSELLNYLRVLHPSHRTVHLFVLDLPMVKSYLNSQSTSADALAIEMSWLDIIKLAVTADMFQDSYMEGKALSALKQKAMLAISPGNAVLLFHHNDFAFAHAYQTKTGNGEKLMQTLCDIKAIDMGVLQSPEVKLPAAGDTKPKSRGFIRKTRGHKYGNSVLKGMGLDAAGKEGDGKMHPVRQPSVPPNVEALKQGDVSNFVRSDEKDTTM